MSPTKTAPWPKSWQPAPRRAAGPHTRSSEPADDHGGTRAFDYILDYLSTGSSDGPGSPGSPGTAVDVPEHTWREAVTCAPAGRRLGLAYNAYESGQLRYAQDLWRQAADDLDRPDEAPRAAVNLGRLLSEQGRPEQAEAAYRQAIDSGHPEAAPKAAVSLGLLLAQQGQPQQDAAHDEARSPENTERTSR